MSAAGLSPAELGHALPPEIRTQAIGLLNARLADAMELSTQARQAHWNVESPGFSSLHLLFDAVQVTVDGYVDRIAERVVQLGGVARIVPGEIIAPVDPDDDPLGLADGVTRVSALAAQLAEFADAMRRAIGTLTQWGDPGSADVCIQISREVGQWLWMVETQRQTGSAPPQQVIVH